MKWRIAFVPATGRMEVRLADLSIDLKIHFRKNDTGKLGFSKFDKKHTYSSMFLDLPHLPRGIDKAIKDGKWPFPKAVEVSTVCTPFRSAVIIIIIL